MDFSIGHLGSPEPICFCAYTPLHAWSHILFLVRLLFALLAGARGLCSFLRLDSGLDFLLVRARKLMGNA